MERNQISFDGYPTNKRHPIGVQNGFLQKASKQKRIQHMNDRKTRARTATQFLQKAK